METHWSQDFPSTSASFFRVQNEYQAKRIFQVPQWRCLRLTVHEHAHNLWEEFGLPHNKAVTVKGAAELL